MSELWQDGDLLEHEDGSIYVVSKGMLHAMVEMNPQAVSAWHGVIPITKQGMWDMRRIGRGEAIFAGGTGPAGVEP